MNTLKKTKKSGALTGLFKAVSKAIRFNIASKIIFFMIGIALWFNINLQKEFETTVNIPIIVSNIQEGRTLLNPIPEYAKIKIRSKGKNLLMSDFNNDVFFEIDASGITDSATININNDLFVNTSGEELEPLFIYHPQEIMLELDNLEIKKIPVKLNSNFTLAPGYLPTGKFTLEPESVLISGPASILKTIKFVNTVKNVENDLTRDYLKEINLILADSSSIKFSHKKVRVSQMIVRKGVNSFKAPIRIINKPETMNILIDPIAIDITVTGPVNELQKITADSFTVTADAGELDNISNKIPVRVTTEIGLKWKFETTEVKAIQY